ncbi:hypothetical protein CT153_11340 [Aeromonas veronii]|nr:hypothetical protein CT153_11340 [Aeromonas veronii]
MAVSPRSSISKRCSHLNATLCTKGGSWKYRLNKRLTRSLWESPTSEYLAQALVMPGREHTLLNQVTNMTFDHKTLNR